MSKCPRAEKRVRLWRLKKSAVPEKSRSEHNTATWFYKKIDFVSVAPLSMKVKFESLPGE